MKGRGIRRLQEQRRKEKFRKIIHEMEKEIQSPFRSPMPIEIGTVDPKWVGRMASTPHPCSGRCCGNPRRHEKGTDKYTMQELKEMEKELSQ